ncbi:MAG: energy-coupling factor ABC transporter ATP-binding protein, partial [Halobacteriota archaeon]
REAIEVKGLNYSYSDGTRALDNIDFKAFEGEKVVVVGPNGAGKTTFLLHLNGILKGNRGKVEVFGQDASEMSREDIVRNVGVVFQDPDDQLFMPTIFDDVAFGPINLGLSESLVRERVANALSTVGFTGYENRAPHNLSFGEKKKAALAAVLSMEPQILVLDEPTANLDPKSRRDLLQKIKELNKRGITIIIASHDVNALPELADRIYVLNKKMVAEGSPREIFSNSQLLKENKLEVPEVFKLFEVLNCFGYNCEHLPLSIEDAIEELTRTIETAEGHIHLHIHEHTHDDVQKLKKKYDHQKED